jgi:hypothetical protein
LLDDRRMKKGSGSGRKKHADPVDPEPDSDPDPAIFIIDLQDANQKLI